MSKHTPGEWEVVRGRCGPSVEVFGGGKAITEMWDRGDKETQEANARLIAAAPDLYQALKRLLEAGYNADHEDYTVATKAIKKAEGGE